MKLSTLSTPKCQLNGGVQIKRKVGEKFQSSINGGFIITRELEFEKRLKMIIKRWKKEKEVIIKHIAKIYTEIYS